MCVYARTHIPKYCNLLKLYMCRSGVVHVYSVSRMTLVIYGALLKSPRRVAGKPSVTFPAPRTFFVILPCNFIFWPDRQY